MRSDRPVIAVTGAGGFIGKNLMVRLAEQGHAARPLRRDTPEDEARAALGQSDIVFHLAGANRPADPAEFMATNRDGARRVAEAIAGGRRRPLVVVGSSAKACDGSDYGQSKLAGEEVMLELDQRGLATVLVYRLPNVFGKWARPNYNSAVATFCNNLARGLPIRIADAEAPLDLLYVDDLIDQWLNHVANPPIEGGMIEPLGVHRTTVGAVADRLRGFAATRERGEVGEVGEGLQRALYATFVSHLPETAFSYPLESHRDERGSFVEMLKTPTCGQISYFTALPGITRGGHYHHSKVEKFLVVHGKARVRFRHILTGDSHELVVSADDPMVVESIPGWTHDITNIGEATMVAVVWANQRFDAGRPDTVTMPL